MQESIVFETEYRVFVQFQNGNFCGFTILTLQDLFDTICSLKGVTAISIFNIRK